MKKYLIIGFLFFVCACGHLGKIDTRIHTAQNQNVFTEIDGIENAKYHKLAFIEHGLASNMEHQVVQTAKQAFLDNNYVVVTFDARHSTGESGNDVEKARLSTFEEDLKTVIDWAQTQPFYHEPFALSGHSLGGASVLQYSAENPEQVVLLIPVAPVISGNLWEQSCMQNMSDFCRQWKQNGFYEYTDKQNGKTVRIPYAVVTASKNYNAYTIAPQIRAKTLLIGAQKDIIIDAAELQQLAKSLHGGQSEVIADSGHNFEQKQNQADLYQKIDKFIKDNPL
ncbi:MAG: alpha/beta fold hydrolase [Alphaproteobacteria bacterium]